ncbi:MAG: M36 family metallopeptidase [Saprospiraceae bacterium]|nr:M36 family metallopeptidase [Saprospiraceae bacterium]
MIKTTLHRFLLMAGAVLCLGISLQAQNIPLAKEKALRFLQTNPSQFNLTAADVSDVRITDAFVSKHNGITHVWIQQQHAGIPVYNALFGLHVKPDGSVFHQGHRFVAELARQVNTTLPSLAATQALELAMTDLGFTGFPTPAVKRKVNEQNWVFESGAVSKAEIPVSICYALSTKGSPRLAWTLVIDQANTSDMWTIMVDAQTGRVLNKINHTQYCKAGHFHAAGETCSDEQTTSPAATAPATASDAADERYNVFALPTESPAHGGRTIVTNPADPTASPYGWLDVNGVAGNEYTYTRGNNVWAFDDSANDNTGSAAESANGGATLNFDFPFDPLAEPQANLEAAITNLFYMNNMMHDYTYRFGFDEVSGNFQGNTYGRGGTGNDAVSAHAIDGAGTNNANFSTPADGGSGRMQMFTWSGASGNIITVNAPANVAGIYFANASTAANPSWGGPITDVPVTGEVVITDDGTGTDDATKNCKPAVNSLLGKIAMLDRGVCEFGRKALNAQQAGAIGCIICNYEDTGAGIGAGAVGAQVTIPTVMMDKKECDKLRQYAGTGLNISIVKPVISGPDFIDGDFDNGIIAHEYGHGISNRLTGGPSQAGCLSNAEQMGEGWSDWFALVTTTKPGDTPEKRRGTGTFVQRQPNDGVGIRRYPYSTDMSINPITFGDVALNTEVHALGEIWAQVTWDLYWAFVEKYGYDADLSNTSSGNFRAIQHVMDGMKFQPCSPGFIDGRDAIMAANILNYDAVDTCLISSVFARRGMGYFASQGDASNASDGVENFDPIPTCVKELKIKKVTSTPLVVPGENAEFTITVTNHKDETATGVVVKDPLPAGWSLVSASNGGTLNAGSVTWNIGDMATLDVITLTYTAKSDPSDKSLLQFRDPMDDAGDVWIALINDEGDQTFFLQDTDVKVGTQAWRVESPATETDQVLQYYNASVKVNGDKPTMRFWHKYVTEAGADAGFIEIQRVGSLQWNRIPADKVLRGKYVGIQYGTFAIPFLNGFSGNSNGWIQSYIDMSAFAGDDVTFRFRFGTDDNTATAGDGWVIDQVDFIDMVNHDLEACVTSAQGDIACARAPESGVIMDTDDVVGTDEAIANALGLRVQPNPATDLLTLSFGESTQGAAQILILSADGRVVSRRQVDNVFAGQVLTLDVATLPAGMYVVRVESNGGSSVAKVAKR